LGNNGKTIEQLKKAARQAPDIASEGGELTKSMAEWLAAKLGIISQEKKFYQKPRFYITGGIVLSFLAIIKALFGTKSD
jgi:hypothetical protein